MERDTDRETERQADRQKNRRTDGQSDRHTQMDRRSAWQTDSSVKKQKNERAMLYKKTMVEVDTEQKKICEFENVKEEPKEKERRRVDLL